MSNVPHTVTNTAVTAVVSGKTYTVKAGDPAYAKAREAVLKKDWEALMRYASKVLAIEQWCRGRFTVNTKTSTISFDGEKLPQALNQRIVLMARDGQDPSRWLRFWQKLQENPSWGSVQALFTFMANGNLPLAEDGDLLAYKSVRRSYRDHHSNTWDNSPGTVIQIARNKVSDNYAQACSVGFHIGTLKYAQSFGRDGRIVICKVNPRDVVCVPADASQGKIRCCRYQVVGNYGDDLDSTYFDEDVLPPLEIAEIAEAGSVAELPDKFIEPLEEAPSTVNKKLDAPRSAIKQVQIGAPADRRAVLMAKPMDELRGHAVKLGIKGAGHIKGGKVNLVDNHILPKEKELGYVAGEPLPEVQPVIPAEKTRKAKHEAQKATRQKEALVKAETPAPVVKPADPNNPYEVLDTYSKAQLEVLDLDVLRKYACHHLKIVGASKIRGGKEALVARIIEVRSH